MSIGQSGAESGAEWTVPRLVNVDMELVTYD
jgi:hypothetical protein